MKPTPGVVVAVWLVVLLWAGPAALAALPLVVGTDASEQIKGTRKTEEIRGLGGPDEITDGLGRDLVYGNAGKDNLIGSGGDTSVDHFDGGAGDDIIQSRDVPAAKHRIWCGPGVDRVYADEADVVSGHCERVRAW